MKLQCNCGVIITKDLYPYKNFIIDGARANNDFSYKDYAVRVGTFKHTSYHASLKSPFWLKGERYDINKCDLVFTAVKLDEFKTGKGCCDIDCGDVVCNGCKTKLGYEFSDCWQTQCITFIGKNIKRVFK